MSADFRARYPRRRRSTAIAQAEHEHEAVHSPVRAAILVALLVVVAIGGMIERRVSRPGVGVPAAPDASGITASSQARAASPSATSVPDSEFLPLVTVAPVYPREAQAAGTTGRCTVEFTVTATGATRDARAVDCEPQGVFEAAALAAARQFKYRPRTRGGEPVDVPGVRNEFVFSLEH